MGDFGKLLSFLDVGPFSLAEDFLVDFVVFVETSTCGLKW